MSRADTPEDGIEPELLMGWLEFHRDALAAKCADLTNEQLIARSVPPSDMSLIGLIRHMTEMERAFFVYGMGGGGPLRLSYCTDEDPDGDFEFDGTEVVGPSLAAWRAERSHADRVIAGAGLDDLGQGNGRSLRWNMLKVIQEYARHNGHADLVRQAIDGSTGE